MNDIDLDLFFDSLHGTKVNSGCNNKLAVTRSLNGRISTVAENNKPEFWLTWRVQGVTGTEAYNSTYSLYNMKFILSRHISI